MAKGTGITPPMLKAINDHCVARTCVYSPVHLPAESCVYWKGVTLESNPYQNTQGQKKTTALSRLKQRYLTKGECEDPN
jgi:hypothetical protein